MPGGIKKTKPKSKKTKTEKEKNTKKTKKAKKVELKVRVKNQPPKEIEVIDPIIEEKKPEVKKEKKIKKQPRKEKIKKQQAEKGKIIYEDTERDRRVIMWTAVMFFMILIFGGWLYNAKKVFQDTKIEDNKESVFNFESWDKMTSELGEKISQMKEDLKSLDEFEGENLDLQDATSSERTLFATSSEESLDIVTEEEENTAKTQIELLKEKLEALEKEIGEDEL